MILQALHGYAEAERLVEGMEVKDRLVHLVLTIEPDGSPAAVAPWQVLEPIVTEKDRRTPKKELGRPLPLPEFPGVNSGGKAYFLADAADKVLGLNARTGDPILDDGSNAAKAFQHFWLRIAEAFEKTQVP